MKKKVMLLCGVLVMAALSTVWAGSFNDANKNLIKAARDQDFELLQEALYNRANLNYKESSSDKTALMIACEGDWLEGVRFLLENGANHSLKNAADQTALMFAVGHCQDDMLLKYLASYNVNVDDRDSSGKTVLMYAVDNDSDNSLVFLLKRTRANPKATDNDGCNAMMYAAKNGKYAAFKHLASLPGVNWDQKDIDGNTAFMLAVTNGNTAIVRYCLTGGTGFDIAKKMEGGQPVLFWAIEKGKSEEIIGMIMRAYDPDVLRTTKDKKKRDIRWYIDTYKNGYARKVLSEIMN